MHKMYIFAFLKIGHNFVRKITKNDQKDIECIWFHIGLSWTTSISFNPCCKFRHSGINSVMWSTSTKIDDSNWNQKWDLLPICTYIFRFDSRGVLVQGVGRVWYKVWPVSGTRCDKVWYEVWQSLVQGVKGFGKRCDKVWYMVWQGLVQGVASVWCKV